MSTLTNTRQKTTTVALTADDITMIRCGLLRRMDSMVGRPECAESYVRSRQLLEMFWRARKEMMED